MVIYKITNIINGKIYVGQSKYDNPTYLGSGIYIIQAVKKYGKENFKREIIEVCENQKLTDEREKFWIKELKAREKNIGYNVASGGSSYIMNEEIAKKISKILKGKYVGENSFRKGIRLTEDHKKCISEANSGRILTGETKKKMSDSKKGIVFSMESRKKMSDSHKLKKLSDDHKINISKGLMGRIVEESTKKILREKNINKTQKNSLIIHATSTDGKNYMVFSNSCEASRFFKCTRQRIKLNGVSGWDIKIYKKGQC
jgi:group I intron endonuclease